MTSSENIKMSNLKRTLLVFNVQFTSEYILNQAVVYLFTGASV